MKTYEFYVISIGTMVGTKEDLKRAYELWGNSKVIILRTW